MPVFGGGQPAAVTAKTADYTVVAGDNGTIFTTRGASGAVNFTLPLLSTLTAGWSATFVNEVDQNMTVTANATDADKMVVVNDATADSIAYSTASEKIGAAVRVVVNDNLSKWLVIEMSNEIVTSTIAT